MSFWSSEKLKNRLSNKIIIPYNEKNIKYGAYELALGKEYYTTDEKTKKKRVLETSEQLSIKPGQFALLTSEEWISVPSTNLCFISIKAGIKFRGLVNISGFHVDPGYFGHLKFSVYNAGSQNINVTQGKPLFMVWFADLDQETSDLYKGNNGGVEAIKSDDVMNISGDIPSPAELFQEMKEMKKALQFWKNVFVTLSFSIISGLVVFFFKKFWDAQ
ncbi:hypothetical protein [Desulfovibrio sp.]|uniref:dCTP deaminase domain-containing protein n=1 Tax=Desulfovibrio sp. TaxID=885 RepID=UPI0025C53091|nr:hypothetical protein [Desulfovibrio sp.]